MSLQNWQKKNKRKMPNSQCGDTYIWNITTNECSPQNHMIYFALKAGYLIMRAFFVVRYYCYTLSAIQSSSTTPKNTCRAALLYVIS